MTEQTKKCGRCKIVKTLISFHKHKGHKFDHDDICKSCLSEIGKNLSFERTTNDKKCGQCHEVKNCTDFHTYTRSRDGLNRICNTCKKLNHDKKINTLEGHVKNILRYTKSHSKKIKREFNIIYEDVINLYEKQNGLCAISKIKMTYNHISDNESHDIENLSIDRIDPKKGYTKDNIQLVCVIVNRMKLDLEVNMFYQLCALVAQNN